eukprot:698586-Lingulodinium_polyedra.AAC.1
MRAGAWTGFLHQVRPRAGPGHRRLCPRATTRPREARASPRAVRRSLTPANGSRSRSPTTPL